VPFSCRDIYDINMMFYIESEIAEGLI